jgi:hypothetical protein
MTHSPEIQELIDVVKNQIDLSQRGFDIDRGLLSEAIENLTPKPAKPREFWVNIFPEGVNFVYETFGSAKAILGPHCETIQVREVMADEPAWCIPTWEQVPKDISGQIETGGIGAINESSYNYLRNALMKVKP